MSIKKILLILPIALCAGVAFICYEYSKSGVPDHVKVLGSKILHTITPGMPSSDGIHEYSLHEKHVTEETSRILALSGVSDTEKVRQVRDLGYEYSITYAILTNQSRPLMTNRERDDLFRKFYNESRNTLSLNLLLRVGSALFNEDAKQAYMASINTYRDEEAKKRLIMWQVNSLNKQERQILLACQDYLYKRFDPGSFMYVPLVIKDYAVKNRPQECEAL